MIHWQFQYHVSFLLQTKDFQQESHHTRTWNWLDTMLLLHAKKKQEKLTQQTTRRVRIVAVVLTIGMNTFQGIQVQPQKKSLFQKKKVFCELNPSNKNGGTRSVILLLLVLLY